jgi:hypothetical protein
MDASPSAHCVQEHAARPHQVFGSPPARWEGPWPCTALRADATTARDAAPNHLGGGDVTDRPCSGSVWPELLASTHEQPPRQACKGSPHAALTYPADIEKHPGGAQIRRYAELHAPHISRRYIEGT